MSLDATHNLGLAEFSNEATEVTTINHGISKELIPLPDEDYQDIKKYFERPRLWAKYNAATTRSVIAGIDISSGPALNPIARFWPADALRRLAGVYAYRCTIKFTLTLAATPFQQGLVTIGFQYGAGSNTEVHARGLFPPLSTNVPHARLNFADTTIAELVVPYIFPYDFFELTNTAVGGGDAVDFPAGHFAIVQQLPYTTLPGVTAPRMSLYVSLHDMVLYGAVPITLGAVIPQSGKTIEKEAKETKKGVKASSVLSTVSKVSGTVGKVAGTLGIPFLSTAGTTVSWLTDKLAGTAKAFGYSKPIIEDFTSRNALIASAHDGNVDIPDPSAVVAPFSCNRLDLGPVDGTTVDELSLPYVLSQWNQVFVGQLTTSLADGTFVYATRCSPTNLWFRTNNGTPGGNIPLPVSGTLTTNAYAPTTLCYLAPMFRYFRGGLKFRFTFAKTKFHAGRVVASFVPSTEDFSTLSVGTSLVPLPEVSNGGIQPFTSSAIFDLKDDSVFEFEVPYICTRSWLSTLGSFGGVTLGILDTIRTTGETASTIPFLVEVCAMPDFEFANYVGTGTIAAMGPASNSQVVLLQSGLQLEEVDDSPMIPMPTTESVNFRLESGASMDQINPLTDKEREVCHYTMGEKITSLKEIMQIPYYSTYVQAPGTGTNVQCTLPSWAYYPDVALAAPYNNTANFGFANIPGSLIAHMYAYCAGGTTYHVFSSNSDVQMFIRQNPIDGGVLNAVPSGTVSDPRFRGPCVPIRHYAAGGAVNFLHAKCPSYQKVPLVPRDNFGLLGSNFIFGTVATAPSPYKNTGWILQTASGSASATQTRFTIGIAASDDAKCFQYIGPPPVLLPSSTSTATVTENFAGGV